jgi:hypothetical protein
MYIYTKKINMHISKPLHICIHTYVYILMYNHAEKNDIRETTPPRKMVWLTENESAKCDFRSLYIYIHVHTVYKFKFK